MVINLSSRDLVLREIKINEDAPLGIESQSIPSVAALNDILVRKLRVTGTGLIGESSPG